MNTILLYCDNKGRLNSVEVGFRNNVRIWKIEKIDPGHDTSHMKRDGEIVAKLPHFNVVSISDGKGGHHEDHEVECWIRPFPPSSIDAEDYAAIRKAAEESKGEEWVQEKLFDLDDRRLGKTF